MVRTKINKIKSDGSNDIGFRIEISLKYEIINKIKSRIAEVNPRGTNF